MEKYMVTGMSCAACQARVEKAVSNVEGVTECNVNLLTNSMGVSGNADTAAIIKAVEDAGYGASLMEDAGASKEKASDFSAEEEALRDKETPVLKKRLISSIGFLIVLMYFSMGHMMFGFPLPEFFNGNHVAMGIVQMLLAIIVMVINKKFFISGFKGLIHRAPNMDTLVALGSAASFGYSVVALFLMTDAQVKGDTELVMHYMDEFYFESAAMILTLITVGKMLEAMSKGRTTDAIKSLMKLAPKTANIIDEKGNEKTVSIDSVAIGDIFTVRPGENVPVDGIIVEGNTSIDESALTGESIPVDKSVGSEVSAATINTAGFIKCRATRVGRDTTLSQIIQMVSDAAATKAPIAKIADRVSGVFVPAVIGIALLTILVWCILGAEFGYALARGIAVLVISCPCALGLATPVAIMVGNGMGAKNGIMFKTAASLENAGKTQIVALDKTGTITMGEPVVTDVFSADSITRSGYSASNYESFDDKLLTYAGIIEQKSEHPLAKAITKYVTDLHIDWEFENMEVSDFKAVFGNGLEANVDGHIIRGGNRDFISKFAGIPGEILEKATALAMQGKTPMYFARDNKLLGIIAVADTIKEDSARAISELKNMGIRVVMLTGDNEKTAKAIAGKAGVDDYVAGVLPDGKEEIIRKLSEKGKVAMVGDGINDAPALTRADTGIAIGAGTDIAIDAADVVLMKSSLLDVSGAIRLSRATLRNIHQNLFWAFFYNVLGIPLAAGCYIKLFGWALSPMFGAAAMSLSSFFVVTNALRLNFFNLHDASKDKKIKNAITEDISADFGRKGAENTESDTEANNISMEENTMTKTMKIEGMMCGHCEARVKKALENLDAVESAVVSHEEGTAVVTLSGEVENDFLKKAVEDEDYKVVSIS